ncbi:MAG TPA: response regulator transcription factor [Candidatus Acidoferrales bacterium]|nr:response regulator transcription factor [Candidatus Acidoferrales bacterium]
MKTRRHNRSIIHKTRILVVDDHPVVREGLRVLIGGQPDLELVGEAEDGRQVLHFVKAWRPEIVIMDLTMPQFNGLRAIALLKQNQAAVKVLVLTVHESEAYLRELMAAGVAGYVLKRSAAEEVLRAVRSIAAGGVYFDHRLAEKNLIEQMGAQVMPGKALKTQPSPQEEKVLRLLAWGYTNKEIGGKLGVSMKSVETYRTRICQKLSLRSRTDIVRFALHRGWLNEE